MPRSQILLMTLPVVTRRGSTVDETLPREDGLGPITLLAPAGGVLDEDSPRF